MINYDYIDILLRYTLIGIISGYLLIYGLRPSVPYPEQILELCEHYWIIIILIIINYYILLWDLKMGLLLTLGIVALIFDMVLFTK
jgi:hypothetical protein